MTVLQIIHAKAQQEKGSSLYNSLYFLRSVIFPLYENILVQSLWNYEQKQGILYTQ